MAPSGRQLAGAASSGRPCPGGVGGCGFSCGRGLDRERGDPRRQSRAVSLGARAGAGGADGAAPLPAVSV